ncbi:MAG: GNAT family N-acetyltransferase, partial [Fimbriimonadaceae bacterium]|nr:GNAT family N-acetyltransferase [Fimbriimonadaceae bacterium]
MIALRAWQATDSIPALTSLFHQAYAPLLDAGMNFTAATQPDKVTQERATNGVTMTAWDGDNLIGAITLHPNTDNLLYRQPGIGVIGPFAVLPDRQGKGIGRRLFDAIEGLAIEKGLRAVALDTAEPAVHLVAMYESWGMRRVGYMQWREKTYRSVLMAKWLNSPCIRPCQREDSAQAMQVVQSVFGEYGFTWDGSDYFDDLAGLPDTYPDGFWVAERNNEVVGVGGLERHDRFTGEPGQLVHVEDQLRVAGTDGELVRMYVLPSARKQGIGSGIGECICNEARYLGMRALEIWSDKKLEDAHRLYAKMGAVRVGERICDDPDESPEWG